MALPNVGDFAWGGTLNAQITGDETNIAALISNLAAHVGNNPADPHGDRAYASALVSPITTGTNLPNGYVKLDGTGHVPANLLPSAGGTNNFYDVRNAQFGAVGSGTVDDSAAINAALAAAAAAGSGVVWVPAGLYGIGSPLVIGSGTLLLLSPGATIQRISPVSAPTVMLKNYASGFAASTGSFTVEGGKWDAVGTTNQHSKNTIFSFVNASQVIIENTTLNQYARGDSSFGEFYGCSSVSVFNVTLTGIAPTVSRAACVNPCFRVEQTHSSNIPGLVAGDYTFAMCNAVYIQNVSHQCATGSDSDGLFTAWHSLCGTIGIVNDHTKFHTNIKLISCDATAFAHYGIYALNWNNVSFINCLIGSPRDGLYIQNWVTVAPAQVIWTAQDSWHAVTYQNGWSSGTSGSKLGILSLSDGLVKLSGVVNSASAGATVIIATVPSQYAPVNRNEYFLCFDVNTGNVIDGYVDTSGNIHLNPNGIGNNNTLVIDTIYPTAATFLT